MAIFTMYADKSQSYIWDQDNVFHFKFNIVKTKLIFLIMFLFSTHLELPSSSQQATPILPLSLLPITITSALLALP